jgi:tetratricopeptide (TPR) repeat protein
LFDEFGLDRALQSAFDQSHRAQEIAAKILQTSPGEGLALARMRDAVSHNPEVAVSLCSAAVVDPLVPNAIAWALAAAQLVGEEDPRRNECLLQALSLKAVDFRRAGDLVEAEKMLERAARFECGDFVANAVHLEAKADLRRAQHRLDEAWAACLMACAYYRKANTRRLFGRAYLLKAVILIDRGDGEEALQAVCRATANLERTARNRMLCTQALCGALGLSGDYEQIDRVLAEESDSFAAASFVDRARIAWFVAAICCARAKPAQAEHYYRQARDGFIVAGAAWLVATVTIELCEKVFLPSGRTGLVRSMVGETLPTLERLGLEAAQLQAWRLLRKATLRDVSQIASAIRAVGRGAGEAHLRR